MSEATKVGPRNKCGDDNKNAVVTPCRDTGPMSAPVRDPVSLHAMTE